MSNATVLAGFGLLAGVLSAQAGAQEEEPLQDVVVTAQFRSEPVQDTPLAITALGSQQLEEQGEVSSSPAVRTTATIRTTRRSRSPILPPTRADREPAAIRP